MKGNWLRNCFFKNRSEFNKISGSKQQNLSVSFLRKTETDYYSNLNKKDVTDNKQFCQTVKLYNNSIFRFLKVTAKDVVNEFSKVLI